MKIKIDDNSKKRMKDQTLGYITGAFGLVAGLAWNDAIKSLIEMIFPVSASSIYIKFIYAILITILVVIIGHYLFRLSERGDTKS